MNERYSEIILHIKYFLSEFDPMVSSYRTFFLESDAAQIDCHYFLMAVLLGGIH